MTLRIISLGLTALLIACTPSTSEKLSTMDVTDAAQVEMTSATDKVLDMTASFIPVDFSVPTLVETGSFKLVPLGPELTDIDFEAYMSSIDHLQKTFTRSTAWPHKDISHEDALKDMETEQARFLGRKSFAYAVLTPDGKRERGCVYVYPSTVDGYDAVVRLWVTSAEYDAGFDAELYAFAANWVKNDWPFEKVAFPGRDIAWDSWDALVASSAEALIEKNILTAEGFIDAFYSFEPEKLSAFLTNTDETASRILYYQGWAEGGNYKVLKRGACEVESTNVIRCPITVQDDPVMALKTGFNVTDTFHLTFDGTHIASIKTSSDDQPIYYEARKWVEANMPEVMTGPCLDRNKGGKTPGDCARAMTEGYKQFYAATRGTSSGE